MNVRHGDEQAACAARLKGGLSLPGLGTAFGQPAESVLLSLAAVVCSQPLVGQFWIDWYVRALRQYACM